MKGVKQTTVIKPVLMKITSADNKTHNKPHFCVLKVCKWSFFFRRLSMNLKIAHWDELQHKL